MKSFVAATAGMALPDFDPSEAFVSEQGGHDKKGTVSPQDALSLLKEGNFRYAAMKRKRLSDSGVGPSARKPLTCGQWPYATILCCSDSRVPPELIFDEGLGRLFIVRVAGNVINSALNKTNKD